jgi:hypothetical protein
LTVEASNSSLNQILSDIARETNIRIVGGVVDERVFGAYGPADPARILAVLLDGTSSNMLLRASTGSASGELVLTPRFGGPTPPSPASSRTENRLPDQEQTDLPPQQMRPPEPPASASMPNPPNSQPPSPEATPASAPDASTPTAPPADSTQVQSPNGVKTPQQIYEQLMQLQKQQQPTATPPE